MTDTLELKGFDKLDRAMRDFPKRLREEIKKAQELNGLMGESAIIQAIDSRDFAPNRPMTVKLKGNSTPLVDSNSLRASITHKVPSWDEAIMGVLRKKKVKNGSGTGSEDIFNVAAAVHDGFTITVTPKMRRYLAARGTPLAPTTRVIRVTGRPFLTSAVKGSIQDTYVRNFEDAINRAMKVK